MKWWFVAAVLAVGALAILWALAMLVLRWVVQD